MASCGAPPSTLIIMNLLATSVFTHYNKVSPIKDLDGMPPKVNGTNIDYIDDAFSGKNKPLMDNKYDVDPAEKLGTIEIDIQSYNDKQNVDIKGGFQTNKGASGADSTIDDLIKQTGLTSNQLDDIMKYTVKNADELLGSLKKGDLLDIIQGRNIDFIKVDISKYDEFVSKGLKPSNSPKIEKWLEKGGAIEVNSDGSLWKYTDKYKNAVYYRDDFPDFYSYKHPNVNPVSIEIARPKNNPADFKAANEAAGLGPNSNPPVFDMRNPPKGYTWHHMEDGKTMILVEENIHDTFRHKGGQSLINGKGVK